MLSERHESFRYEFTPPLQCEFNISVDHEPEKASPFGIGEINNISPHGLMFSTPLNIPKHWDMISISIKFVLLDMEFLVSGHFKWRESHLERYVYGVHLNTDEELQRKIVEQLKKYSKQKLDLARNKKA